MMEDFEQVAEAYLLAQAEGERDTLERLAAAYPQYEERLLAFALLDAAVPTVPARIDLAAMAPLVTSELTQRALRAAFAPEQGLQLAGILARGEEIGLSARALAEAVDLPRDLVLQLDRRLIAVRTVPRRCLQRLAAALQTSAESVQAFLAGGPAAQVAAYNYASAPPRLGAQQSFAQALTASGLATEAQRAAWLAAVAEEGLDR